MDSKVDVTLNSPTTVQAITELSYGKDAVRKHIRSLIENYHETKRGKKTFRKFEKYYVKYLKKYHKKKFHKSKQKRLRNFMRDKTFENNRELFNLILELTLPIRDFDIINMTISRLSKRIYEESKYETKWCMTTAAEILALAHHAEIITIYGDHLGLYIVSEVKVKKIDRNYMKDIAFLPPMLVKPEDISKNKDKTALTFETDLINRYVNRHNEKLNYSTINKLQQTALTLNHEILQYKERVTSKKANSPITKKYRKKFIKECKETYKYLGDKPFYAMWYYDSRGRVYFRGHHVNFQGNDYKRASICLYKQEKLNTRGIHYLLLTLANNYKHGLDKKSESIRLEWSKKNIDLDMFEAENPYQFRAVQKVLQNPNRSTGVMVGQDATSSGTMMMAALIGCLQSMENVNLAHTGEFRNPPTLILDRLKKIAKKSKMLRRITPKEMKNVYMTTLYYSRKKPKEMFGDGTKLLASFYKAIRKTFPGVVKVQESFARCIDPDKDTYTWWMPDNHYCKTHTLVNYLSRIEIQELNGKRFTHIHKEIEADESSVAIIANAIHSVDSLVARQLVIRCNYDKVAMEKLLYEVGLEISLRDRKRVKIAKGNLHDKIAVKFLRFNLHNLGGFELSYVTIKELRRLKVFLRDLLDYPPFEILPIHDEFQCSPIHMDRLNYHFARIMYDINHYDVLNFMLEQLNTEHRKVKVNKLPLKYFTGKYALS